MPKPRRLSRRAFLALLLGLSACAGRTPVAPIPYPHLRVEPTIGMQGQLATATLTHMETLARPAWRWARFTVESPDGTSIDSLWAVPLQGSVSRRWQLRGEGPTIVTLRLYTADLTWPDWQTEFLLDTHAILP